ncbi:MAG: ABC transporter ATP-binding protein [Chloroflexi bacterium]|uniref:ABC transporter ATP-binding protein n=1 Tax=Candidatus Chlorohelix allophototropha TaxID=3003348 RepID=A0A8T7M0N3_9CHLR|nr:ABC transporter ATP-binding protein [Chloroflexota bacterium]WJW67303.1 ABC transporter ATP-binding protein [Chloroflexota bacterium L227-S17]
MSSSKYLIEVDNVSKYYKLHHERKGTLQSWFINSLGRKKKLDEDFWALKDVSFKLGRGRTLGVIGRNGAGKSTLLKLVTGIIQPTEGRIRVNGRVSAMLELGTGFHPDLTARDNIFLNGAIYGFSKKDMEQRYDRIVDFSELGKFIDTPVKHYSSGMYMRLAFAVAITVNPEILVVDEVLAVGDAAFGRKCYDELERMKKANVSILFVSHGPGEIARFCDEAIYLANGRIVAQGTPPEVLKMYEQQTNPTFISTR